MLPNCHLLTRTAEVFLSSQRSCVFFRPHAGETGHCRAESFCLDGHQSKARRERQGGQNCQFSVGFTERSLTSADLLRVPSPSHRHAIRPAPLSSRALSLPLSAGIEQRAPLCSSPMRRRVCHGSHPLPARARARQGCRLAIPRVHTPHSTAGVTRHNADATSRRRRGRSQSRRNRSRAGSFGDAASCPTTGP